MTAEQPLPQGWRWAKLGEVCTVVGGSTPSSVVDTFWNGDIPWVTPVDLGMLSGPLITTTARKITQVGYDNSSTEMVPVGAVVLSSRAPIGYLGIAAVPLCTNQGCKSFVPKAGVNSEYLYWALREAVPMLQSLGSGATFTEVSKSALQGFAIPLPPMAEQQRIAARLYAQMAEVERARAAARAQIGMATDYVSALFQAFFRSSLMVLPDGWKWVRLGEVADINPPRPPLRATDSQPTTFVPMAAVSDKLGIIAQPEVKAFSQVRKGYTYFENGDVIFAKITPCMQNGKHAVARDLLNGFAFGSTEFHVIRSRNGVLPKWIHYYLRQSRFLTEATNHFTGAVGQQRLPESYLAAALIPIAPVETQQETIDKMDMQMLEVENTVSSCSAQLAAIDALPAALLRAAFTGQLV